KDGTGDKKRRRLPALPDLSKRSPRTAHDRAYERAALLWQGKPLWGRHCFALHIAAPEAEKAKKDPWFETTPQTWRMVFETDVVSAVRLILATVPDVRAAGWGRIINVASGMATTPQAVMADYAAAKAAMVNSTVSLAKALAGTGVTVNTVPPGVIHTES